MKSYTGLRALFSFDESVAETNKSNGLTLVSYGVVAAAYSRLMDEFSGDENALFNEAIKGERKDIKYVPVYNADGTGANRYTNYEKREFCVSLTNIASENSLTDIYTAGYVIWKDAEGNLGYTLSTYSMPDGEKAVNLYEITLGLTKNGLLNSEFVDDICFWQVLKNGALTVGDFTYCDVDWHAYTSSSSNNYWWGGTWSGVSETPSGLVWSVLKYTDSEYVLIYRNKDKSTYTDLRIPVYSTEKGWDAPWHHAYGNEGFTTYNPTLSQDDYMKIQTLVVDHGVAGTSKSGAGLAGMAPIKVNNVNYGLDTIVYPSEFKAYEQTFTKTGMLRDVIWCHTDENGDPVEHLSEFNGLTSLIDLRGFTSIGFVDAFAGVWNAQNIVFRSDVKAVARKDSDKGLATQMFNSSAGVKRVWSEGQDVPAEGVMNLTGLGIVKITTKTFHLSGNNINTIMLPSTITSVAGSKTDSYTFGNKLAINYVCDETLETMIVTHIQTYSSNLKTQVAKISVNGKAITDLVTFG